MSKNQHPDTSTSENFQAVKNYYSKDIHRPDLFHKFRNIDKGSNLAASRSYLVSPGTKSFTLDFGSKDAWCATNLEKDDFVALLESKRPQCFETRWINIWDPESQKDSLRAITDHYGLSARLQGMMCTEPPPPTPKPTQGTWSIHEEEEEDEELSDNPDDIEGGHKLKNSSTFEAAKEKAGAGDIKFSDIVNEIWHFSSVDYGKRYLCLGYNSIFSVPKIRFQKSTSLPDSKRIWCWLILCDDGTVISIQENPFPTPQSQSRMEGEPHTEEERGKTISIIRRNIALVFTGISEAHHPNNSTGLISMKVRQFTNDSGDKNGTNECASLLFYALFDDWVTIYSVVARREQPYGAALEALRGSMLSRAKLDLIEELHRLGRQLGVLKRIYKTYELTVNRLLQQQRMLRDEARSKDSYKTEGTHPEAHMAERQTGWESAPTVNANGDSAVGVRLSSSAIVRFERLADRIRLYALGEIEECLNEKEALTFLNFNLIALKDSQAVEKLTRITILLAKATILFLPVSLMTAYFSTEIPDLQSAYSAKTYWVCFAVITVLSIVVLWIFGLASDTVEGKTIYRSLAKTFFENSRAAIGRRKRKSR